MYLACPLCRFLLRTSIGRWWQLAKKWGFTSQLYFLPHDKHFIGRGNRVRDKIRYRQVQHCDLPLGNTMSWTEPDTGVCLSKGRRANLCCSGSGRHPPNPSPAETHSGTLLSPGCHFPPVWYSTNAINSSCPQQVVPSVTIGLNKVPQQWSQILVSGPCYTLTNYAESWRTFVNVGFTYQCSLYQRLLKICIYKYI